MGFISLLKKYNRYKKNKSFINQRSTYYASQQEHYKKAQNYYNFMMNYKKRKSK